MADARRLRVLHLAKFYPPERGGMERVLQQVCEATEDDVENVVLAAHTASGTVRERVGRIAVIRAGRLLQCGSVAVCPSFPVWLRRTSADLVVVHEPNALALVAHWLVASKAPLVVWFHADLVRPSWKYDRLYKPFLTRALNQARAVVVSSPQLGESATGLREFRHKCAVVPFGVDADAFDVRAPAPAWLREFHAAHAGRLALMVGRMVPYKGVGVALRALVGTDLRLVIVGTGPELVAAQAEVRALGLADRVHFAGSLSDDDLRACYQVCDFLVMPSVSRQETFGVVQLEAMAAGTPVINTALPTGVPWVSRHDETGLTVPPGDVEALRSAMVCLASRPDLREAFGAAARERVRREFTLDQVRDRLVAVYRGASTGHAWVAEASPA